MLCWIRVSDQSLCECLWYGQVLESAQHHLLEHLLQVSMLYDLVSFVNKIVFSFLKNLLWFQFGLTDLWEGTSLIVEPIYDLCDFWAGGCSADGTHEFDVDFGTSCHFGLTHIFLGWGLWIMAVVRELESEWSSGGYGQGIYRFHGRTGSRRFSELAWVDGNEIALIYRFIYYDTVSLICYVSYVF